MATLMLADLLLLDEPNPDPTPCKPLVRRPTGMRPIRSLRLRHTTLWLGASPSCRMPRQPSAAPACQRATPRFGARRAYRTPAQPVKVASECSSASTPEPPSGSTWLSGRVTPSPKGKPKDTTQQTLCQVKRTCLGEMLTLPPRWHRRGINTITRSRTMSSSPVGFSSQPCHPLGQY